MLAESCLIDEFTEKIRDLSFEEIICTAHQEATEAERLLYRGGSSGRIDDTHLKQYVGALKDFLIYMRHGVKTIALRQLELAHLDTIRHQTLGIDPSRFH